MSDQTLNPHREVTAFLDALNHPLRKQIDALRVLILNARPGLVELVKWNAPSYTYHNQDRITMKIHPPGRIQLIFHRGTQKLNQPPQKLIEDAAGLLVWKENDRAIATFSKDTDLNSMEAVLHKMVNDWLDATC